MFYQGMMGVHALWWLFWIPFVVAIVFWGPWDSPARRNRARETPHAVLRRRLASGEITPEEYETRKAILDRDTGDKNSAEK